MIKCVVLTNFLVLLRLYTFYKVKLAVQKLQTISCKSLSNNLVLSQFHISVKKSI